MYLKKGGSKIFLLFNIVFYVIWTLANSNPGINIILMTVMAYLDHGFSDTKITPDIIINVACKNILAVMFVEYLHSLVPMIIIRTVANYVAYH